MTGLLFKTLGLWVVMVVIAIGNAGIREMLLVPVIGPDLALSVSGLLLSLFILILAWLSVPFLGATETRAYVAVGTVWFFLTLSFERLLSHFVSGKSWIEVMGVFDVRKGNLFLVALLTTLVSFWLAAKLRGLI